MINLGYPLAFIVLQVCANISDSELQGLPQQFWHARFRCQLDHGILGRNEYSRALQWVHHHGNHHRFDYNNNEA